MLSLSSEKPIKVSINLEGAYWAVKSTPSISRRGGPVTNNVCYILIYCVIDLTQFDLQNQRLHADGYLSFEAPKPVPLLDIEDIRNRCPGHIEAGMFNQSSSFTYS